MSQSLSNLFGGSASSTAGGLFSESAKQKFARVYKPEEFDIPVKTLKEPTEEETEDAAAVENSKKKPRKRKAEAPADGAAASAETNEDGSAAAPVEGGKGGDLDTIFVGNIPVTESVKTLTKFFKTYGEVDNIRLRSVPVAGAKVDEAGNQDLVRKVCVNAKKFGEQKGSFNAYIKFKDTASATAALAANNQLMGTRHIRVDRATPTLFDPKRSVFLGGLPHYADEEDIRDYFAKVLENGQDDIEGMRIIRDNVSLVGKGIGYMLFKDRDCVLKALALHKGVYKKRWALRVTACGKRTKRAEHAKQPANTSTAADSTAEEGSADATGSDSAGDSSKRTESGKKDRWRDRAEGDERSAKKPRGPGPADHAMRRIKHKTVVTRNKILKERGQKKKEKGRRGKRLGGVVKRAMKASKSQ